MLNKKILGALGASILMGSTAVAEASYISTVSFSSSDYLITGFENSPVNEYQIQLNNFTDNGSSVNLPDPGMYNWTAGGSVVLDILNNANPIDDVTVFDNPLTPVTTGPLVGPWLGTSFDFVFPVISGGGIINSLLQMNITTGDFDGGVGGLDAIFSIDEMAAGVSSVFATLKMLDDAGLNNDQVDGDRIDINLTLQAVPEPATVALFALGLAGFGLTSRRAKKTAYKEIG